MKFSELDKVFNCVFNEIPNIDNDTFFLYFSEELHELRSWIALIYDSSHTCSAC